LTKEGNDMTAATDMEQWLAQYRSKIAGVQQAAEELRENIAQSEVTISSPDGAVTVTIAPGGGLRDLKFSHRASEHSYTELAALVMKTVRKGQRGTADKVIEAFEPIGAGSSAMDLLTSLAPEEEPEEELPTNAYDDLAPEAPPAPPAPQPSMAQPPAGFPPAPQPPMPTRAAPPAARPRPARPAVEDDEFDERPW
jgi:DNA-binding protein YbaB